jgi:hypothetical protein
MPRPSEAQAIAVGIGQYQVPSNRKAPIALTAPRLEDINLIAHDFVKYGAGDERRHSWAWTARHECWDSAERLLRWPCRARRTRHRERLTVRHSAARDRLSLWRTLSTIIAGTLRWRSSCQNALR